MILQRMNSNVGSAIEYAVALSQLRRDDIVGIEL